MITDRNVTKNVYRYSKIGINKNTLTIRKKSSIWNHCPICHNGNLP